MIAPLAVTIGVLLLSLRVLRRWTERGRGGDCGIPVRMLQRFGLGPKLAIGILQVGERALVVSLVDNRIEFLTELTGADCDRVLAEHAELSTVVAAPARRLLRLAGLTFGLALIFARGVSAVPIEQADSQSAVATTEQSAANLPQFQVQLGEGENELRLSGTVGIVVLMGLMTLLPALLLVTTSFTRVLIVLHFIRSAVGTPTAPPSQLLVVVAVVLTAMVMRPIIEDTNREAIQPYLKGEITQEVAYGRAVVPIRNFMLANMRSQELAVFTELSGATDVESVEDLPTVTIVSSFVTSELTTAFQMGFVIFLPFIVVDLVVAAVLMSMGMFMLPPVMVSLPFKLMLFVLADGWTLVVQSLVTSFKV